VTLAERAARDRAAITSNVNERAEITVTDPDTATDYTIYGDVYRTDMRFDKEAGVRIFEPRCSITYSSREYTVAIAEGWSVSAPDGSGNTITGAVTSIERNQTLDTVRFHVEVDDG
jgi:hypothetical protein